MSDFCIFGGQLNLNELASVQQSEEGRRLAPNGGNEICPYSACHGVETVSLNMGTVCIAISQGEL